ncbi:2OG-Fe(II)oxygenase, partial [Trichoderma gamsii]
CRICQVNRRLLLTETRVPRLRVVKFCVRSTSGGTCTATALEEISAAIEVGQRDAVARAQAGKAGLVMSRFPTRQKRTIDAFFNSAPKRARIDVVEERSTPDEQDEITTTSQHLHYPFPITDFPASVSKELSSLPARPARVINNEPDLDLLYYEPYIPEYLARQIFQHLRAELPFYKVEYQIKRGGIETQVRTPR